MGGIEVEGGDWEGGGRREEAGGAGRGAGETGGGGRSEDEVKEGELLEEEEEEEEEARSRPPITGEGSRVRESVVTPGVWEGKEQGGEGEEGLLGGGGAGRPGERRS